MTVTVRQQSGRASRWGRSWKASPGTAVLAVPALAFVVVFAIYPLLSFTAGSVWFRGAFTARYYQRLLDSTYFGDVLLRTILTALAVMVLCLVIGYPLAYFVNRAPGRAKVVLIALVVLPYLTSVLVRVFAWSALLGIRGPVNAVAVSLGIFDEPHQLGHSFFGAMIGLVHVLTPIAVLTMWATMSRIERGHEITAAALGSSPVRVFVTVFFPLSAPGVVTAGLLVYVLAIGAYVIPVALGATNGLLFAQVVADTATIALNWGVAGAMTMTMLVVSVVPLLLVQLLRLVARRRRDPYPLRNRLATRFAYPALELVPPKVWAWSARVVAVLVLTFLVAPEIVVVIFSFGPVNSLSLPPERWSVEGYQRFFPDPLWTDPFSRSFLFAAVDAVVAVLLGGLAAYGLVRSKPRTFAVGMGLLAFPLALPEIIPALSFFVFANKTGLASSAAGVVIGQAVTAIGLATIITSTVVRNVDVNLEHASQMCGASRTRTLVRIVAPLALPGLIVAGLYAFLNAFDNLVLPLFVAGRNSTIPVKMFFSMQDQLNSVIAVVATLLIGLLLAATAVAVLLMSRSSAKINVADVAKG